MKTRLMLVVALLVMFGCTGVSEAPSKAMDCVGENCNEDPAYLFIPTSEITPTVKHYEYDHDGAKIRYFAVKAPDGSIKLAFNACEVCFNSGKGYSQDGDSVVCNNCGLKFRISELGERNKGTGCWPAHLEHKIEGDQVLIKKTDMEAGARLFG